MVKSMLVHYDQSPEHMLPVWSNSGNENWCMSGYHSVSVLADALVKAMRPFIPKMPWMLRLLLRVTAAMKAFASIKIKATYPMKKQAYRYPILWSMLMMIGR